MTSVIICICTQHAVVECFVSVEDVRNLPDLMEEELGTIRQIFTPPRILIGFRLGAKV